MKYVLLDISTPKIQRWVICTEPNRLMPMINDHFRYKCSGMQSVSGLRLFETESEFSLVYRDKEGTWRNAGDVPWK